MTQEDKQLLLVDLCARLPYGVMCVFSEPPYGEITEPLRMGGLRAFIEDKWNVKPYLRPMSSMTEEERTYYEDRWFEGYHARHGDDMVSEPEIPDYIDWLNAYHFDYRGLLERGLAIEVTEDNNPYKE